MAPLSRNQKVVSLHRTKGWRQPVSPLIAVHFLSLWASVSVSYWISVFVSLCLCLPACLSFTHAGESTECDDSYVNDERVHLCQHACLCVHAYVNIYIPVQCAWVLRDFCMEVVLGSSAEL